MRGKQLLQLLLWISVAVALVLLFNTYPKVAALVPAPLLLVLLVLRYRKVPRNWNDAFYRGLTPKRTAITGLVVLISAFVWLNVSLSFVGSDADLLLFVAILPSLTMVIFGSILMGVGFYFSGTPGRRQRDA